MLNKGVNIFEYLLLEYYLDTNFQMFFDKISFAQETIINNLKEKADEQKTIVKMLSEVMVKVDQLQSHIQTHEEELIQMIEESTPKKMQNLLTWNRIKTLFLHLKN